MSRITLKQLKKRSVKKSSFIKPSRVRSLSVEEYAFHKEEIEAAIAYSNETIRLNFEEVNPAFIKPLLMDQVATDSFNRIAIKGALRDHGLAYEQGPTKWSNSAAIFNTATKQFDLIEVSAPSGWFDETIVIPREPDSSE